MKYEEQSFRSRPANKAFIDNYDRIFKMKKTVKNGGSTPINEVAADWKKNPSDATKAITTEPSSRWAAQFAETAKKCAK
jgi:hypothetical protein